MKKVLAFTPKKQTLKRNLFGYMFLLVMLLLLLFFIGMLLIDGYSGTKRQLSDTLAFQSDVFERQITTHYSNLAVMGIQLSERTGKSIDQYLTDNALNFDDLCGMQTYITALQELLIAPLHQKLLESDCTGAFILLNTQINPTVENAATSRSGLYLQRNSLDFTDTRILLYRGLADVGKQYGAMPHCKWRLEFDTTLLPDYDLLLAEASLPLTDSYRLSKVVTLPGTSERVMLLTVPIFGASGQFYGLCGLELSENYFKQIFAQPSELTNALFCLSPGQYGLQDASESLTAGIINDYYLLPSGQFSSRRVGSDLFTCESAQTAYIGIIRSVVLSPGQETFSISTLIPRQDYDRLAGRNSLRITLLVLVIVACAVVCCLYFSKRYLWPLMQSIHQIFQNEYTNAESPVAEMDDLFAFLAEQDRQHNAAIAQMQEEKISAEEAPLCAVPTDQPHTAQP